MPDGLTVESHTNENVFSGDWIVFRCARQAGIPVHQVVRLTRVLRKALQRYAGSPSPEIISGHQPDGAPGLKPHAACIPLPLVGFPQARGTLAGFALVLPRMASRDDEALIDQVLARWEGEFRQDDEEFPMLPLYLGRQGRVQIERIAATRPARALRAETWCGPATHWASVTPVVLDRYPGKLFSNKSDVATKARGNARAILERSCRNIGLPEPIHVELVSCSPIAGVPPTDEFPPYPGIKNRQTRFFVHVKAVFDKPVHGPIILGAGRFEGMGLMRPHDVVVTE